MRKRTCPEVRGHVRHGGIIEATSGDARSAHTREGNVRMNTRTIAIIALIIAVIVLLLLLL
jgi:hypothetical protein